MLVRILDQKMHGRIFSNASPREYNLKEREMTDGEHHLNTFSFFEVSQKYL